MTTGDEASSVPLVIRLFGPFDVLVQGRSLPRLRTRKGQWLLALLVLRHGRHVERAWLAGVLWPESSERQALANLRLSLSDLRGALGEEGYRLQSPTTRTLSFDLTHAHADVVAFDRGIRSDALAERKQAIALYRGPLLEGCPEEWAVPEREAREQAVLQGLETLAADARGRRDANAAVIYLRQAVAIDPLREAAQRSLIEALFALGDASAATTAYREFRLLLHRELNSRPDPETVALYQELKSKRSSPAPIANAVPRPDPGWHLPWPLTNLIGRTQEIEAAAVSLRLSRLVTLTGTGGVGKTRLAIAVAEEIADDYPDGICFVDLAPVSAPALVPQAVASALKIAEAPRRPLIDTLGESLRDRRLLLLLDNCEHLLPACAALTDTLLSGCSHLRILATSRQPLGLTGEVVRRVPSLTLPDAMDRAAGEKDMADLLEYAAIQLFVVRAQAVAPDFRLHAENQQAVVDICCRLSGIPLAIELAAARVRALPTEQIAARLEDRFDLLTGGNRASLPRQHTLRATLDWSYDLLTEAERALLRRLSVFAGGWTLEAAEAVGTGGAVEAWEGLDLLTALTDKSLVVYSEQAGRARYHLLETVRQYGQERLRESGEGRALRERHRGFYLTLAEAAEPELTGPKQGIWLERIETEHDNLRAALEWRNDVEALRLAGALWRFWEVRSHFSEGRERLRAALTGPESGGRTVARAKALRGAGVLAFSQGDHGAARKLLEESLALWREVGDRHGVAYALGNLGNVSTEQGHYAAARSLYGESLSVFRELGDRRGIAYALNALGLITSDRGDYGEARSLYEESLSFFQEIRDRRGIALVLGNLGLVSKEQGDYGAARTFLEESLSVFREIGDRRGIGYALLNRGDVSFEQGDYKSARSLYAESLSIFRETGDRRGVGYALNALGLVSLEESGDEAAQPLVLESLSVCREIGDRRGIRDALAGVAALCSVQGESERAARLWGAVEAMHEADGLPLQPNEQSRFARQVADARTALGEQAFSAAWDNGRQMTLEQAVAYALREQIDV